MTITELHTGIKLALQELQSNVYHNIQAEAIDYYINQVTEELLLNLGSLEPSVVTRISRGGTAATSNTIDYDKIREFYNLIRPLISYVDFPITYSGDHVYGTLPEDIGVDSVGGTSTDVIKHGIKYKVIVAGTTPLVDFGGTTPPVLNDIFICDLPNITAPLTGITISIIKGCKYRIVINDGGTYNLTNFGAASNRQGVVFIATSTESFTVVRGLILERITTVPIWGGGTALLPITNDGMYYLISSVSNVDCSKSIKSGTLKKGLTYKVVVAGSTDLSSVLGYSINIVDYLMTPTVDTTPEWDGTTVLTLTRNVENNLVLPQDFGNYQNNSYGTDVNCPTSVIRNNKLYVYSDNSFNINKVYLTYARIPGRVSKEHDVTSELSLHTLLVSAVVQRIAGQNNNDNYRTMLNEYKNLNKDI